MDQEIVRRRLMDWLQGGAEGQDLPAENESVWDLWPVALRFDDQGKPYAKVLDEDTGRLYRIDVSVSGNDVTFGKFVEVMEQDVPVAAAAGNRPPGRVWASRADVRPTPTDEETDMDIAALREAAGLTAEQLPDDATPEQITEALRLPVGEAPVEKPEGEQQAPPLEEKPAEQQVAASAPPPGTRIVDEQEWETVKAGSAEGARLAKEKAEQERERTIKAAMSEGRFAPARKAHYETLWQADPEGTKHLLTASADKGGLAPNTVPVSAQSTQPQDEPGEQQGTGLFPHIYDNQEA
jgi:hypothetical protein